MFTAVLEPINLFLCCLLVSQVSVLCISQSVMSISDELWVPTGCVTWGFTGAPTCHHRLSIMKSFRFIIIKAANHLFFASDVSFYLLHLHLLWYDIFAYIAFCTWKELPVVAIFHLPSMLFSSRRASFTLPPPVLSLSLSLSLLFPLSSSPLLSSSLQTSEM